MPCECLPRRDGLPEAVIAQNEAGTQPLANDSSNKLGAAECQDEGCETDSQRLLLGRQLLASLVGNLQQHLEDRSTRYEGHKNIRVSARNRPDEDHLVQT